MLLTPGNKRTSGRTLLQPVPVRVPSSVALVLTSAAAAHVFAVFRKRRSPRRTINSNSVAVLAPPHPQRSHDRLKCRLSCERAKGIRKNEKVVQSTGASYSLLACKRSLKDARPLSFSYHQDLLSFHSYRKRALLLIVLGKGLDTTIMKTTTKGGVTSVVEQEKFVVPDLSVKDLLSAIP